MFCLFLICIPDLFKVHCHFAMCAMCLFSLQLGISTGMVDANIKSGHLQSFHWGHWGQDGSDKKQRQPQSCHEALAAVQLH